MLCGGGRVFYAANPGIESLLPSPLMRFQSSGIKGCVEMACAAPQSLRTCRERGFLLRAEVEVVYKKVQERRPLTARGPPFVVVH